MQTLESIKDFFKHIDFSKLHFGHKWFMHFGVPVGFYDFVTHFLNEVLFQDVAYIDDLPFFGNTQVTLRILFSCVTYHLLISLKQYFFLLPSHFFWRVSTIKLCKYVGTLWV
jgi:hypothetical protein